MFQLQKNEKRSKHCTNIGTPRGREEKKNKIKQGTNSQLVHISTIKLTYQKD